MIFGFDLAGVKGNWVEAGGAEEAGPAAGGDGRFAQDTTVGSTLCTGVEEASGGAFKKEHVE